VVRKWWRGEGSTLGGGRTGCLPVGLPTVAGLSEAQAETEMTASRHRTPHVPSVYSTGVNAVVQHPPCASFPPSIHEIGTGGLCALGFLMGHLGPVDLRHTPFGVA
jgi:hypothetical protein